MECEFIYEHTFYIMAKNKQREKIIHTVQYEFSQHMISKCGMEFNPGINRSERGTKL